MENKESKPKKAVPKKKADPKKELAAELLKMADKIDKTVKEERNKSLNTSSCARLNRAKVDLRQTAKQLSQ